MGPGYPADRFLSPVHVTEGGGSAAVSHSEQRRPALRVRGVLQGWRPGAPVRGEPPLATLTRPWHSLLLFAGCCHVP